MSAAHSPRRIRVGSRESLLAVAQAKSVMESIKRANSGIDLELVTMRTQGDRLSARYPASEPQRASNLAVKGLFVKELESALLNGDIDLAVHSLKDMSLEKNPDLPIVAYSVREDPRDAMVMKTDAASEQTSPGRLVAGCSSPRRRAQLKRIMRCGIRQIRGNVLTRLDRLDGGGEYDFLILAAAGLIRLGLRNRISCLFPIDRMTPAAGQGIIACQGRGGDDYGFLKDTSDRDSEICAAAERAFAAAAGGDCSSPVAACAAVCGEELFLTGFYAGDEDGPFIRDSASGSAGRAEAIGERLALELLSRFNGGELAHV
jgi:hydroxymethylbilane synthase